MTDFELSHQSRGGRNCDGCRKGASIDYDEVSQSVQSSVKIVQDLHQKGQETRDSRMINLHSQTPTRGIYDLTGLMALVN